MTEVKSTDIGVKLCIKCQKVKPLLTGYYKARNSWQKYCKPCNNERKKEIIKIKKEKEKGETFDPETNEYYNTEDENDEKIGFETF